MAQGVHTQVKVVCQRQGDLDFLLLRQLDSVQQSFGGGGSMSPGVQPAIKIVCCCLLCLSQSDGVSASKSNGDLLERFCLENKNVC